MSDKKKDVFLPIGIFITELLLIKLGYIFIAFTILFAYSLYKLYPERYRLAKITKSAYALKFYNVVIWFISYLLTLKMLSAIYNIDEEYLKYSPALVAIPVSICILYFLLIIVASIFSIAGIIISNFSYFFPIWLKDNYEQSIFVKIIKILQNLIIVLLIPFFLAALSTDYVARVAILLDASFLSDCGGKQWRVMYLRKNNNECYKFTLDRNVFSEEPSIVKSKK